MLCTVHATPLDAQPEAAQGKPATAGSPDPWVSGQAMTYMSEARRRSIASNASLVNGTSLGFGRIVEQQVLE